MTSAESVRVLWLTENYYPAKGGMAQSCDRIVNGLRESGLTIDLVHFTHHVSQIKVETKNNGRLFLCPPGNDPSHSINCLWNFVGRNSESRQITHVVAFGGMMPLIAAPVFAAWLNVPLVTLIRGNDFDAAVFTPRRAEVLHEALRRSTRVCVVSRDKATKINALYPGIEPTWIPNGIDLRDWEPLPSQLTRAAKWKETNADGRQVLGMFGQIKPKKGGLFFLEALKASGRADQFHLLFVGELDQEVIDWLAENSHFAATSLPFTDRYDLLGHYPACDLVVLPSFYDGLPNVLLEAAALGIPLLASTAGGMADVLEDGVHAFLFHPGDQEDCRLAIERAALADNDLLKILGRNCRSLVQSRLTHKQEIESYVSVLLETLTSQEQSVSGSIADYETSLQAEGNCAD